MTSSDKVQVFISWSGTHARDIARALHKWIDAMFDNATPWMSDIDIAGGQRGLEEIDKSLDGSGFGIIVVTSENHQAPWINYEAGALGRAVADSKVRVMPILVDLRLQDVSLGPIGQFQHALLDHDGIRRLSHSLGTVLGLAPASVDTKLDVWLPKLDESLAAISAPSATPPKPSRPEADVLDEILAGVLTIRNEVGRLSAPGVPLRPTRPVVGRAVAVDTADRDLKQIARGMIAGSDITFTIDDRGRERLVLVVPAETPDDVVAAALNELEGLAGTTLEVRYQVVIASRTRQSASREKLLSHADRYGVPATDDAEPGDPAEEPPAD
ncbi:toll/interleukin-1 receptor domain-containing protein [Nocardioides sp. WV_118_6]